MDKLPIELIDKILLNIQFCCDKKKYSLVSKAWKEIVNKETLLCRFSPFCGINTCYYHNSEIISKISRRLLLYEY